MYEDFHVSYQGTPAFGLYLTAQNDDTGLFFRWADGTQTARVTGDSPTPYKLALQSRGGDDWSVVTQPVANLPVGVWRIRYYEQLAATETDNDLQLGPAKVLRWSGVAASIAAPGYSSGLGYATETDLETFLATYNLTSYADLDGDLIRDANAVMQVIDWAEADVNSYAAGGPALTPLAFAGGTAAQQAVARQVVKRWTVWLAAYYVAAKRGLTGVELDRFKALRDSALAEIAAFREGTMGLPGLTADPDDVADHPGGFRNRTLVRADMVATVGDEFAS